MKAPNPNFYLLPGLGADERVFKFLKLHGNVNILGWLPLHSPTETLSQYATRMATMIPEQQKCWLIGVSFGGVLALEIARLRPLATAILVSSISNEAQLPLTLRLAKATGIYRLLPPQLLKLFPRVAQWFFGAKGRTQYRLLVQIIKDTDPQFARWAMHQLLNWDSTDVGLAIRIHGNHDRLLPIGKAFIDYPIENAGHFMIVSHAQQISTIINALAIADADSSQGSLPDFNS